MGSSNLKIIKSISNNDISSQLGISLATPIEHFHASLYKKEDEVGE